MAQDYLQINTDILKNDISKMNELTQKISSAVDDMNNSLTELNGMWSGPANTAFCEQFDKDSQNIKDYIQHLTNFFSQLSQERAEYDKCEQNVISAVHSIGI